MITIRTTSETDAEIKIEKGTSYTTMLLGIEMLIEALIKNVPDLALDYVLEELKRIYERDINGK